MSSRRLAYTSALEAWEAENLVALLTDDVVIRVAVHDAPMQGKEIARFLFGVLSDELAPPRATDEIIDGGKAVVLFETSIGDHAAQGLTVLDIDDSGLIRELTVFFRPLESLGRIADVVGARMAAQFGPPPR